MTPNDDPPPAEDARPSTTTRSEAPPFTLLAVCTANQCRSPLAEMLLRDALRSVGVGWLVGSAGTRAAGDEPMNESTAAVLRSRGFEVSGWRSRSLSAELIERSGLILTAATAQRSQVVTMSPAALQRTFTLLQFARLAAHIEPIDDPAGPDSGDRLLERVRAARSHVQPALAGDDDIADPIGRRMRAFRACAEKISTAVTTIVTPLSPHRH